MRKGLVEREVEGVSFKHKVRRTVPALSVFGAAAGVASALVGGVRGDPSASPKSHRVATESVCACGGGCA